MIYRAKRGQVSYGEAIGILLMDTFVPFVPGDVGNATTYSYPVRFHTVHNVTAKRVLNHDLSCLEDIVEAGEILVKAGVRAVTGDCGFMAIYQRQVAQELGVPVFLSSLIQVPFLSSMLSSEHKVGIITADSKALNSDVLEGAGIQLPTKVTVKGLQDCENFRSAILDETGWLDTDKVESEVVEAVREMLRNDPQVKIILLECSDLAPYAAAVHEAVDLPVYDFVTMTNYVYSGIIKKRFVGHM